MQASNLNQALGSPETFKEIWLNHQNGTSLCALINNDVGWLMYMRFKGDSGFSTRNPNSSSNNQIKFRLNNGQQDYYPESWTYDLKALSEAMLSFLDDGQLPSQLGWHDDSKDDE